MRQVWKYPLAWAPIPQTVQMPAGAKIVHVAEQHGLPTMWAEVEPVQAVEDRSFVLVGTGSPVPADHDAYCGTLHQGGFVFHVYEAPTRQ